MRRFDVGLPAEQVIRICREHWDGGWATDTAEALSGVRRLD